MKTRVILREQVKDFISALAPAPRRKLWAAVKSLARDEGNVIQLEGNLAPYFRLRVDKYRVVFEEKAVRGERHLICYYADYRATVYTALSQMIAENLLGEMTKD